MNKLEIRKKILKLRKQNYLKNSEINYKNLLKIFKKNKTIGNIVGGYYPYNFEIDTLNVFKKLEKLNFIIALPKIKKNSQMNFFKWSTDEPLVVNKYGIPEPISKKVIFPNILLVPLVAFDKHLNRIGYGGGFYDRFIDRMRKKKKIITIGLAYSFQKINKVPINKHDIKLDFIVTEKKIK